MCENKTVKIAGVLLLAAAVFCTYQVNSETKVGHHSEIKCENPCRKEYKKYCLHEGECVYLVDEDIVTCNCTWLYRRKRCEKNHLVDLGKLSFFKI